MLPDQEAIVYQRLIRDGKPNLFHQMPTLWGYSGKMFRHFEHGECPIVVLIRSQRQALLTVKDVLGIEDVHGFGIEPLTDAKEAEVQFVDSVKTEVGS